MVILKIFALIPSFICIIHLSFGTENQNTSVSNNPFILQDIPVSSDQLKETTLNPVLAERLLNTVRDNDFLWKHPIFRSLVETPFCSTQPTAFKPQKSHRPITNRLFAEKKIVIPTRKGSARSHQFVYFQYQHRDPLFIPLLECYCYIIKVHNYYKDPLKNIEHQTNTTTPPTTIHVSTADMQSNFNVASKEDFFVEVDDLSKNEAADNMETTLQADARDEKASVVDELEDEQTELLQNRDIFAADKSHNVRITNEIKSNIERMVADNSTKGKINWGKSAQPVERILPPVVDALGLPAEEICVDGKFIYLSKGTAGDSSFFVYQRNGFSFHVIAHLVFNKS